MALLENYDTNTIITRYVNLEISQKVNRITQTALNGNVHIQIIGNMATEYIVNAYVDKTGKNLLLEAEAFVAIIHIIVNYVTYYGRITSLKFSDRMAGGYYKATIELAKADIS